MRGQHADASAEQRRECTHISACILDSMPSSKGPAWRPHPGSILHAQQHKARAGGVQLREEEQHGYSSDGDTRGKRCTSEQAHCRSPEVRILRASALSSRLCADQPETRAGESAAESRDRKRLAKQGADSSAPAMGQTGIQERDSDSEPFLLW